MSTERAYSVTPVSRDARPSAGPVTQEVLGHLTMALASHVRRLHRDGYAVPREVHDLTTAFAHLASTRLEPPTRAPGGGPRHHERVPDLLLVTKAEAAERLGVSVRTVERLAATGRLPQVHVERAVRFRVKDLELYVDSLTESVDSVHDYSEGRRTPAAGAAPGGQVV